MSKSKFLNQHKSHQTKRALLNVLGTNSAHSPRVKIRQPSAETTFSELKFCSICVIIDKNTAQKLSLKCHASVQEEKKLTTTRKERLKTETTR